MLYSNVFGVLFGAQVTAHKATSTQLLPGASQEWRVLRFVPERSSSNLIQAGEPISAQGRQCHGTTQAKNPDSPRQHCGMAYFLRFVVQEGRQLSDPSSHECNGILINLWMRRGF